MTTTRLLLLGASGRMGRAVDAAAARDDRVQVVGRYAQTARPELGILGSDALAGAPAFDVAIDFSRPEALEGSLSLCQARGAALVTGTTGLGAEATAALADAATRIALLHAANFSMGVAVLEALVAEAARALPGWDLDIVELHHRGKRDAPSGTALALGAAAEAARSAVASPARPVRYASLRAGDAVGEHCVQLAGEGERLELVHRASDRAVFARGAIEAAWRLSGRPAGRYRFADLLLG